jgi:predicted metalloprotease
VRRWFIFLATAVAIFGLVLGVPRPAMAQAGPAPRRTLDTFLNRDVAPVLDTFWSDTARVNGFAYTSPNVRLFRPAPSVTSACDRSPVASHSYCALDRTLYLDLGQSEAYSFGSLWQRDKDFAIVLIVAHEWGHHVQHQLGLTERAASVRDVELQADCMAGLFTRYADERGLLDPGDLEEGFDVSMASGDPTHGTGPERTRAVQTGYESYRLSACGIRR